MLSLGSGILGINEYALIDFIYQQDFINIQHGVGRTKNLVKQMKMKNYPIKREKNTFYFEKPENCRIILSMDLDLKGSHRYLKNIMPEFSRSDVEGLLSLQKENRRGYKLYLIRLLLDNNYDFSALIGLLFPSIIEEIAREVIS